MVGPVSTKSEKDKSAGKVKGRALELNSRSLSFDPYIDIMDLQNRAGNQAVSQLLQPGMDTVPPIVHEVLCSSGQSLDPTTRADMEERFGNNFSHVQVHTDAKAADSADIINARAYTVGTDIVFAADEYAPHSSSGRRLLAHELTHVVQQSSVMSTATHTGLSIGDPNSQAESTAERSSNVALQMVHGHLGHAGQLVGHVGTLQVQRQPSPSVSDTVAKLEQIRRAVNQLAYQLEAVKARRDEQEKINQDQWAVSWFSEQVGSVAGALKGKGLRALNIPEKSIWNTSDRLFKEVRHWLAAGDVIRAAHKLQNLADEFTKTNKEFNEYLEGVIGGAEISTTGLEVAAAVGAIAAAVATGGAAAGAGLTVLGTSAVVGVGAGTYGLVQETATQSGEMFAGLRKVGDFDKAILTRGGKDAVMGFVGAITGGVLTKYAINYFGRIILSRMTPGQIAKLAVHLGVDAIDLTPQVLLSKGQQFLIEFFTGAATTPITTAVEVTLNNLTGVPSRESFVEMVVENAIEGGLLQLFLGVLTHGRALKPGKGRKSVSLPDAPAEIPLQSRQESTADIQAKTRSSFASPNEPIVQSKTLPDVPAEMPLQSHQEWTADIQAKTRSSFASPNEPIAQSETFSEAPKQNLFQLSQEASQDFTAIKQLEVGTPRPGAGQNEFGSEVGGKPMEFRKTKSRGKAKRSRKAELEQTEIASKKQVAAGGMSKAGEFEPTAYEPYNHPGKQRFLGREEQMYDQRDLEVWQAHRKKSDDFRHQTTPTLSKSSLKVDDPDPAFPGKTVTAINEDHIVPIRRIRDLPGFAKLNDEIAKFEIENMPQNLELVSESVNKSRGDLFYEEWGKTDSGLKSDPAWLAQQMVKEKQIMKIIQARIDELLRIQMTGEWALRLGMPQW